MRHVIALATLALLAVPARVRGQGDFHGCPVQGDATAPVARALNNFKNRATAPLPGQLDPRATLAALLAPGDDRGRWNAHRGAAVVGYVHDVKPGGIETANCRARDVPSRDTHIELVLDPMHPDASRRVVVEVTPRWRARVAAQGVDWSTPALRRQILGRWVRVTGWLLLDAEHENAAENTAPGRPRNWRGTAWEVHPITALAVVPRPH